MLDTGSHHACLPRQDLSKEKHPLADVSTRLEEAKAQEKAVQAALRALDRLEGPEGPERTALWVHYDGPPTAGSPWHPSSLSELLERFRGQEEGAMVCRVAGSSPSSAEQPVSLAVELQQHPAVDEALQDVERLRGQLDASLKQVGGWGGGGGGSRGWGGVQLSDIGSL